MANANFRKSLISKCIVDHGTVEADTKSLQNVLDNSAEGDNSKLMSYAWQHVIPATQRVGLYKQLLGISGCYKDTKEIVAKHRDEEARILLRCLQTMRTFDGTITESGEPQPTTWDIVKMILLAHGQLSQSVMEAGEEAVHPPGVHEMIAITKQVNLLCPDNWIDVFFISRGIVKLMNRIFDYSTLQETVQQIRHRVNMNKEVKEQVEWRKIDLAFWLRSCMCGVVTCDRTMFRIFDKVVTGQCVVSLLRSLAVAFVTQKILGKLDDATEQRCAAHAIESTWRDVKGSKSRGQWGRPWTVDLEDSEPPRPVTWQRQTVA